MAADKNTVLSLSPSKEALVIRETTLRGAGMKVISVLSPVKARFEIEMGRCGNLLICYRLSVKAADEIAQLYKKYCPKGRIVFITDDTGKEIPADADVHIPESSEPEKMIQAFKAGF
jgi:hypothetical protein